MQQNHSSYTSQQPQAAAQANSGYAPRPPTATGSYRDPPAIETYILPDQANLSIPPEIRERYQRDELGRVIFFTAPPVIPAAPTGSAQAHSVRYLAAKARRDAARGQKRSAEDALDKHFSAKKARAHESAEQAKRDLAAVQLRAMRELEGQLAASVARELDDADLGRLAEGQRDAARLQREVAEHVKLRAQSRRVQIDNAVFGDDWDGRLG